MWAVIFLPLACTNFSCFCQILVHAYQPHKARLLSSLVPFDLYKFLLQLVSFFILTCIFFIQACSLFEAPLRKNSKNLFIDLLISKKSSIFAPNLEKTENYGNNDHSV